MIHFNLTYYCVRKIFLSSRHITKENKKTINKVTEKELELELELEYQNNKIIKTICN